MSANNHFHEHEVIHDLKHYLPAQSPLKDFVHHNTLHAFQNTNFHEAILKASEIFGYKVTLTLKEYRDLYKCKRIREDIIRKVIADHKGKEHADIWFSKLTEHNYHTSINPRIGSLRANWKNKFRIDIDNLVHPILFRVLCSYLDQGISIWNFPVREKGFLACIKELEKNSLSSLFKTERARKLLLRGKHEIQDLLEILVGEPSLYKHYLFDQQFSHQGWSGIVSAIEDQPQTMLDRKQISLRELIIFELLLEIDALDSHFDDVWAPLGTRIHGHLKDLFSEVPHSEIHEVFFLWQEALEWSYYDQVLAGIQHHGTAKEHLQGRSFQAMFCIDDRECSLRRYLEKFDPFCETFATPGFFGVEFFYQPEEGKHYTKLCPAPVTPKYLIKEIGSKQKREKDVYLNKYSHSFHSGWLISQTIGVWSALRLALNIFRPTMSPATASSFRHMDKHSQLTIENKGLQDRENDLQIGFTVDEMITRVEAVLKSVGLIKDFAPVIYMIGHGSSSVNNPHYAAYDCGACSGRPGSVNARVFCAMVNHPKVREGLKERGLDIPSTTQFVGGLHDTTRDEISFFDEKSLSVENALLHKKNEATFLKALDLNAKERSRRLVSIDTTQEPEKIHKEILKRSVSLFEPRPELNHATNALCIVGRRQISDHLFLDRRSFMNSYDYKIDPDGTYLFNILKAAAPVCGGINLEYFFSRVDNQKLGAGSKLPHNVMGLFGVANGIDGDLRPGLPKQMIEVHDPLRLLVIVEHFPDVTLKTIQKSHETYEWFINEWIHLIVVHPETGQFYKFQKGGFTEYVPLQKKLETVKDINKLIESHEENIPVYLIS